MSAEPRPLPCTLAVHPGDTLVVGIDSEWDDAEIERAKDDLEERVPGVKFAFILGATSMAVYRADDSGALETKVSGPCVAARSDAP